MYNKIFTKILDSSIWLESNETRIVWLTMLASMDQDGFCQFAAPANLAHRAIVDLPAAEAAIKVLESPDPHSSDSDNNGRRIERVDGGWMVLNASKYRDIVTAAESRKKTRERVVRFRQKQIGNADVTPGNVSVMQSEAYTEAEAEKEPPAITPDPTPPHDTEFSISAIARVHPRNTKPVAAERAICDQLTRLMKRMAAETALVYLRERTLLYAESVKGWPEGEKKFIPESHNWFSQGCFEADEKLWIHHRKENGNGKSNPAIDALKKISDPDPDG